MALDAAILALTARELNERLAGARVDKIFQPTRDEAVLMMRSRAGSAKLLLSARSGAARIGITGESFENPQVPPSFCMLLRKYLTSGRLEEVRAERGERLVYFVFGCTNEMGDPVRITLAAELMGRYANIVVIGGEGRIIDALKRVDLDASAVRPLLPGLPYTLPPRQGKPDFFEIEPDALLLRMAGFDAPVADALLKAASGIAPSVCREIAFRALGEGRFFTKELTDAQRQALGRQIAALQAEYAAGGRPTAVVDEEGKPVEYSFTPLTQYQPRCRLVARESYCALLEAHYAAKDQAERLRQKSRNLGKTVQNLYERAKRKQTARLEEQAATERSDHLRIWGELLQANLYNIPKGAKEATVENYYDGSTVTIPLDVRLSPSANAQKYFKEYKKKQTAAKMLKKLLADGQREIDYLASVQYEVSQATGEAALAEIREELRAGGYLKNDRRRDKRQKPADFLRYTSSDGFEILVGRNNAQNDKLTLHTARGRDLWFHVKDAPGSHTVVLSRGREIPLATQNEAAMLAVFHSSQSASAKVPVDYTEVRNIRKTGDLKPGMVLFEKHETAYVTPDEAVLRRLGAIGPAGR